MKNRVYCKSHTSSKTAGYLRRLVLTWNRTLEKWEIRNPPENKNTLKKPHRNHPSMANHEQIIAREKLSDHYRCEINVQIIRHLPRLFP